MLRRFALLLLLSSASAWTTVSRRDVMNTLAVGGILGSNAATATALELCPPNSNNCVRTAWKPPAGTSKKDAAETFLQVLNTYPQEGQEKGNVDGGGWQLVEDDLAGEGTARVEFKSSGKGNFAKFFNAGKPFVDDLKVEVQDDGTIQIRSQSRVGDSDFGVNKKRVDFLAGAIKSKGWTV